MSKTDHMNRKRKARRKGLMTFGITALVLSSIFHPFRIFDIALLGGFAYVVGKIVSIMAEGLDTTTRNKQDRPMKEIESIQKSGDDTADSVINQGREILRKIRAENDAIPDPTLTEQMYELERICAQIFKTVAEKPAKASQIRKFMSYYLPTTLKMLASYRTMQNRGVSRSNLTEARSTLIRGMNMVLTACQKQLDNLFRDDMLDVSTDIDVLEQMLKRDGFVDGGLGNVPAGEAEVDAIYKGRTAAAAQMGERDVPTLDTRIDDSEANFPSFYEQKRN